LKNKFIPFWDAGKHIVYEAHHWSVQAVDKASLKVIAHSDFGIEAVHHTKQPIIGMQFHPEVRENTQKLLDKLVIWETLLEPARVEVA
jgi:gamma-glutamyl-gamma-aminobutyrate hydrolase PuuD